MPKENHLVLKECPVCRKGITLAKAALNRKVRCPSCRQTSVILDDDSGAPEPVALAGSPRDEDLSGRQPVFKAEPEANRLEPEDAGMLRDIIASIESEPQGTCFVFLKDLGRANGVYHIEPGNAAALGRLKELLVSRR